MEDPMPSTIVDPSKHVCNPNPARLTYPYEGGIFEVIDQAVECVLGKLDRHVGTREYSTRAPGDSEFPRSIITEAIVNAVSLRIL